MNAYQQYGQSRQQGEEMLRLGKAYADEAQRQASLSKEQLAVEKEIASIKKDLAANGGFLRMIRSRRWRSAMSPPTRRDRRAVAPLR
ncbi:hypothetical protein AJ87_05805 [Rhizobium yanglingense]|nr:hypothetical protein AJ87_05805 [Rhizobium yanglingense]